MMAGYHTSHPCGQFFNRSSNMLQARDLSTNFMAGVDPSSNNGGESKPGLDEHGKEQPEAPRPKGAPNRFFYCFLFTWHNELLYKLFFIALPDQGKASSWRSKPRTPLVITDQDHTHTPTDHDQDHVHEPTDHSGDHNHNHRPLW